MRQLRNASPWKQVSIVSRVTGILGSTLAVCVLGAVLLSRARAPHAFVDLPAYLLPGSPLPAEAQCIEPIDDKPCYFRSVYSVHYHGQDVILTYEPRSAIIVHTVIQASEYTIGDLIIAWGTPTGLVQDGDTVVVAWGTRKAYLSACWFRPDSLVEIITFNMEPRQTSVETGSMRRGCQSTSAIACFPLAASAWRGFVSHECPGTRS